MNLYHGTLVGNKQSIIKHGLNPEVGNYVETVHRLKSGEKFNTIFAADDRHIGHCEYAMRFHIGRLLGVPWCLVTSDQIRSHGLLVVVESTDDWKTVSFNDFYGGVVVPPHGVGPNDWWYVGQEPVHPVEYLEGKDVIRKIFFLGGFTITDEDVERALRYVMEIESCSVEKAYEWFEEYANPVNYRSDILASLKGQFDILPALKDGDS